VQAACEDYILTEPHLQSLQRANEGFNVPSSGILWRQALLGLEVEEARLLKCYVPWLWRWSLVCHRFSSHQAMVLGNVYCLRGLYIRYSSHRNTVVTPPHSDITSIASASACDKMKQFALLWLLPSLALCQSSTSSALPAWATGVETEDGTCGASAGGWVCTPTWGACCSADDICGRSKVACGEGW
jgi:hypothetical protein